MGNNHCAGDFLAGFLVGTLVGAAAALLFAPQSGEETRTLIRDRGIEIKERAEVLSTEARKRAEELQEQAKGRAEEVSGLAKERAQDLQTRVKQAVEEGKAAATTKKEELLSKLDEELPSEQADAEA